MWGKFAVGVEFSVMTTEPPAGGEAQTVLLCEAKVCCEAHAMDGVRAIF
jgi:hypothetical protein